jgi:hypothetical protein
MNKVTNEWESSTLQKRRIIKRYHEQLYASKLNNLNEMEASYLITMKCMYDNMLMLMYDNSKVK